MGEPMCHNLLEAGLPLTVWNRSTEKTKRLAKRGAKAPDSPHVAVAGADVVITMLSDGPAVAELMFERGVADKISNGATRIDMGSIGADEAIEHAKRHAKQGVAYLDAPVSGGTRGAAAGELAIMAGKGKLLPRCNPCLLRLAKRPTSGQAAAGSWPSWPIRSSSPSPSVP